MDTKVGTLEESILGVWQDAVDNIELDERKYTTYQRNVRDLARGQSPAAKRNILKKASRGVEDPNEKKRKHGGTWSPHEDKPSRETHDDQRGVKKTRGDKVSTPNEKERKEKQQKMKMKLLQKKQKAERDRQRASSRGSMSGRSTGGDFGASVGVREELDLEILVLEQMIEGLENSPNPANSQHLCAKNVVHEEWGSGQTIPTMHAEPDAEGNVAWYDVMFEHGIEEGVLISELKVTKSESHMHTASYKGKKKKNEAMDKVDKKALKKDFDDRAKEGDGDIDNDGDEDESDKYLHKKRQAISKSMKETWAEAVRKVKENENGNGEDPSDEDDEDEKKNGKKAKVEINPKMDVDEKKK